MNAAPTRRATSLAVLLVMLLAARPSPVAADDVSDAFRAFRQAQNEKNWKARIEAFDALAFYDGPKVAATMLDAMVADDHPALKLAGVERIGRLVSDDAKAELVEALSTGAAERRFLAILALGRQPGTHGGAELIEIAKGKDPHMAAQALIALGRKHVEDAVPTLLAALRESPDRQLRRAAAEALRLMAGPEPVAPVGPDGRVLPQTKPPPWVPEWYPLDLVVPALIDTLADPKGGVARGDAWTALIRLLKHDMGLDPAAWRELAAGKDPATIEKKPQPVRSLFGIPLFGERMVVILDNSAQIDDPHGYSRERLTELCTVPGARPIPWFQIATKRDFARAWTKRWISDLPKTAKFDVILVNTSILSAFGKLNGASAGTKKTAVETIDESKPVTGQDVLGALLQALHLGGEKDRTAWTKGPEEVLYVSSSKPWLATVNDEDHIGAAIALRSAWLQIPVHTVGVGNHPFPMLRAMSGGAGGRYVDLSR